MPTTIYDSSLLTQRRKMKAEAGDFLRRQQQNQIGYAPRLGIYDQSVINVLRTGTMKFYQKNGDGCTTISNGCPCVPLSSDEEACCGTN